MSPEERLAARRFNEQTKLTAGAINALAIALIGAAIIIPGVRDITAVLSWESLFLLFVALGIHLGARIFLRWLRSEE